MARSYSNRRRTIGSSARFRYTKRRSAVFPSCIATDASASQESGRFDVPRVFRSHPLTDHASAARWRTVRVRSRRDSASAAADRVQAFVVSPPRGPCENARGAVVEFLRTGSREKSVPQEIAGLPRCLFSRRAGTPSRRGARSPRPRKRRLLSLDFLAS
jgi:hypothetical protein